MGTSEPRKLSDISLIGFDLDNTLYPSTEEMQARIRGKIYEKLSSHLGILVERARELFEENYNGVFKWSHSGSRTIAEIGRQLGKTLDGSDLVQQSLEEADIVDFIQPNPALSEMLRRLSGQFDLDLITGSGKGLAVKKLDRLGVSGYAFFYFFSGKEFGSKSTGDVYRHWIQERAVLPHQALYVGDNVRQDVEAPKKLGIRTCLVGKEDAAADYCIKNILDLERLLER